MKIIENRFLPFKGFKAITILNMIFVRKGTYVGPRDITHEEIHWEQEKELLIVGFYPLYLLEFLVRLIIKRNFIEAYKSISFEQEAYANEGNFSYPIWRGRYSWVRFLCR